MMRWPLRPLEEIAELYGGNTPSRENPAFWGGDIPWVTPTDLPMPDEGISVVSKTKERITQAGLDNSSATVIPKGAVLFSSRATIGKVAVANMPLTTNQGFANFVPHSKVTSRFLAYALWIRREDIARLSGSTTFKEVSRSTLRKYQLPVPPLEEQERIVKLVDEADKLRKLRAHADRCTADLIPALFHEMFGDPQRNKKFPILHVGEAGRIQLGRQRAPKYQTGKFTRPYIRVANVFEDRIEVADLLSMDFNQRDFAQYRLEYGDVLLNEGQSTELVGRPAIWRNEVPDCCFQNTLIRFQPDRSKVLPDFALALFLVYFRTGKFASISSKTSNVAHLGAGRLAKMPLIVPPMPLQQEFARRCTEIRGLEAKQAASRERLDALFQSMLHRAFQGEF